MKKYKYVKTISMGDMEFGEYGVISDSPDPTQIGTLMHCNYYRRAWIAIGRRNSFSEVRQDSLIKVDILHPDEIFMVIGRDVFFGTEIEEYINNKIKNKK